MRRSAPRHADGAGAFGSVVFIAAGLVAAVVYAAPMTKDWSQVAFAAVGLGTMVALVVGPIWRHARPRRPWLLLSAASALFLAGALVRTWASHRTGLLAFAADMFTMPGYVLMIGGLAGLLRARGVERHAVIDGLIIWVGTALASILLLALPAASIHGRTAGVSVTAGIYPMFDTVLVLLLVNLAFTTAVRKPAYLLLVGTITLLLGGDLAYAIIGVFGRLTGSPLLDLPFLLGYTLIGAAALHPSVVDLGQATPLPVQAWSIRRLILIVPAVAAPFVLTAVLGDTSALDRILLATGGAIIVALLLVRAVSAVQSYAAAQRRYEHQATHDQLTGLPNRMMLSAQVDEMLAGPTPRGALIWVLFLDLDGFKLVNDSWGHAVGDQLITEVGRRLRQIMPQTATVARVGGDEFVIAHLGTRRDTVGLAEQVFSCFGEPFRMGGAEVVISTSVGIAAALPETPAFGTAEALMRDADTAMYQAKSEGRGRWTMFDSSMHERVRERVDIELALRHALSQRQLRLVYQPIVDLVSGHIHGAEALARWDHPTRGSVAPDAFIPIAEDSGLISRFGRWAVEEALGQLAQWRRDGTVTDEFWLSINVSPRQLRDPVLADALSAGLVRLGIPASAVVLEITESVMIDPSAITHQVLLDLRKLGVRMVVDDFGTGYSALGYLRRHPVTGVKVDRAFVGGLGTNADDEEIVRAVVAMSSAMGLTVVAEGVETRAQQIVLTGLGVELGQGTLWGAPVPPKDFTARWSAALARAGASDYGS